ncbi:MAG: TonB-dependent receptor [Candidatus Aminicenantes bacterium]|nr:TonB-dependent receptor [Candidatus Aminicenantes bacterium]
MTKKRKKLYLLCTFLVFIGFTNFAFPGKKDEAVKDLSLESQMNVEVTSASLYKQKMIEATSNIIVITKEVIEKRGYRNLVEICQDIPGFDFATYEDGGGEFPAHNYNRGIGGINGSPRTLVMIDGIEQNFINFGWSTLWTNENLLIDVKQIEIIQGPGSVTYGSNAYAGVINIITEKDHEGFQGKVWYGQHNSRALDFFYGLKLKNNMNFSAAFHKYISDGDGGKNRYDPGNFFHNNVAPGFLTQHYFDNDTYVTDIPNPLAGQPIPDGFNTSKDDTSFRLRFSLGKGEIGFFYWDRNDGLGSYNTGFQYYANHTDKIYQAHTRGYHIYGKHTWDISDKLELESTVIYRTTMQMPDTGFQYTYKFLDMAKTYNTFNFQGFIKETLHLKLNESNHIVGSFRFMTSLKTAQIVSLDQVQDEYSSSTKSSYDIAAAGGGLGQSKSADTLNSLEYAGVILWEKHFAQKKFRSSIGIRFDHSTEYGTMVSPRFGLIFNPQEEWTLKLLYGTAFRQPSLFELRDEFRGNPELTPEKIDTYEIENHIKLMNDRIHLKANLFYSLLKDAIMLGEVPGIPGEEKHFNTDEYHVRGFSIMGNIQTLHNLYVYTDYIYTEGKNQNADWGHIPHTAAHKFNLGVNWAIFDDLVNINCRLNLVGKRRAPGSNKWLVDNENGYAPGYQKVNLTITLNRLSAKIKLKPQIIIKNLFNEKYYGVGRQNGAADRNSWYSESKSGFIPPYHPQPGTTFMFNLNFEL